MSDGTQNPYGVIYVVTCQDNGKVYVGQTTQVPDVRWNQHRQCPGNSHILGKAILKYGADRFIFRVVDTARTKDELDEKEKYWVVQMNSMAPHGYNIREGGSRGMNSMETRAKMSRAHSGKVLPEDVKAKISAAHMGMRMPRTAAEKISRALRGRKQTAEHVEHSRLGNLGKKRSPESREKIRLGALARWAAHRAAKGTQS